MLKHNWTSDRRKKKKKKSCIFTHKDGGEILVKKTLIRFARI